MSESVSLSVKLSRFRDLRRRLIEGDGDREDATLREAVVDVFLEYAALAGHQETLLMATAREVTWATPARDLRRTCRSIMTIAQD